MTSRFKSFLQLCILKVSHYWSSGMYAKATALCLCVVLCVCETSVSVRGQQRYSWLLGEVLASRRMGKEFLAGVVVTFHCARVPLPLGTYNCVLSRRRLSGALSRKRERINKLLAKHKSASQSRVYVFTRLQRSVCTCSLSKRTLFSLSLKHSHAGTYQTSS